MSFGTFKNQKINSLIIIIVVIMIVMFTACAEKDKKNSGEDDFPIPPALSKNPDITINMSAIITDLSDFTPTQITYRAEPDQVAGYSLDQFVDDSLTRAKTNNATNSRSLFTYNQISSEAAPYTPRDNPNNIGDLDWTDFSKGYFVPSKNNRTHFQELWENNLNLYSTQRIGTFELYRTIVVYKPNGDPVQFHINLLPTSKQMNYANPPVEEDAIKLSDLITNFITTTPQNYKFVITASDNTPYESVTWAQLQAGYFMLGTERARYIGFEDLNSGQARQRNIMKIELVNN